MNNKVKQFIISILIICISAGTFVFAESSDNAPLGEQVHMTQVLKAIGVLDDGDIEAGKNAVTRALAAHLTASLAGVSGLGGEISDTYTDVNERTLYADDIMTLTSLDVLHGYGDKSFRPDDYITAGEAVKIILSAAGYSIPSEAGGGYIGGYLTYAAQSGLLKGVNCVMEDAVSFSDMVKLLYNALDIKVMNTNTISDESISLSAQEGKTVLTQFLHIEKGRGVVEATPLCSITSLQKSLTGYVTIEGSTFREGNSNVSELLGYNVEYYCKENDKGDNVILYASALETVKTLTITDEEFEKYTGSDFIYYSAGKEQKAPVTKLTDIVYNNSPGDISGGLVLSNGNIKLIDNNGDGVYDVVFIEEYRNVYTENIDYENGIIYDEYDAANPVNINLADIGKSVLIYNRKGQPVGLESIKAESLLCCLISRDGQSMVIYEIVDEIIGIVNAVTTEGDTEYVTIGENSYEVAAELKKSGIKWSMGDRLICYLDNRGRLAVVSDNKASKYRWAIFENAHIGEGIAADVSVRVFEEKSDEGQLTNYTLADKVNIDGTLYKKADLAKLSLSDLCEKLGGVRDAIMFKINPDGEINTVATENSDEIYLFSDYTSYYINLTANILGGQIGINESTILFRVPGGEMSEEGYKVGRVGSMLPSHNNYTLKIYQNDPDKLDADVVMIQSTDTVSLFNRYSPSMVVDNVVTALNEDGETVQKIYGYEGSSYISYEGAADDTFTSMSAFGSSDEAVFSAKKGDLIRFVTNEKGQIRIAQLLCRGSESKIYSSSNPSASYTSSARLIFGTVYQKDGVNFRITAKGDVSSVAKSELELFKIASGNPIYVYDAEADEVRVGNVNDLVDYATAPLFCSKAAVYSDTGKINALLIIK